MYLYCKEKRKTLPKNQFFLKRLQNKMMEKGKVGKL